MARRVVLVTGANSGIGWAICKAIAGASPDFHVIMASRSLDKLEAARSEIEVDSSAAKGRLSLVQLDVVDETSVKEAAATVERDHGQLDVLINNAGVGNIDPDTKTRFQACLNTNVLGPALVSEAFRPLLLKSSNPYSIYISSGAGSIGRVADRPKRGAPSMHEGNAYQASKAALNMLAVSEYVDFGPKGLKVFTTCPGFIVSNLRGTSEEARTGGGKATEADVAGKFILDIVEGKRDAEVGQFLHRDGIYPW